MGATRRALFLIAVLTNLSSSALGDGDGRVEGLVSDAVYLLNFNFRLGPAPAEPFPECGPFSLETDGELGCERVAGGCR